MGRPKANIHYIYKTTCKVTGRYYIGIHSTCNLNDGYLGSGLVLRRSIRKYGKESHIKEILEFCVSRELLSQREKEIISTELIHDEKCMNLVIGGEGGFISLSACTKGGKMTGDLHALRLKTDKDYREKYLIMFVDRMKNAHLSGKVKYGVSFKGKKHSDKTKNLMREAKFGQCIGEMNSQYGTCWITNGIENKKIKKEYLDDWINNGWKKGRNKN